MANKSKKNNSQVTQKTEEVVETPVVETPAVEDDVAQEVTQESGEPVSTDVNPNGETIEPAITSEKVEKVVDTESSSEEPVDNVKPSLAGVTSTVSHENPVTLTSKASSSDRYGDNIDEGDDSSPVEPPAPETPTEPVVNEVQEIVDRDLMRKELGINYDVKFSYSQASRRFAVNRKMSLLAMYDLFVKNRQAFVGLKSQDDYNHIHDFMTKYSVLYNYREIPKAGKEQFLEKLRTATDFVVLGK